jgi:tetratricopeptide (TPR) repeat protein
MPLADAAVDVFISYAREDRPCAERLAAAFSACKWRVWWDREIDVGADFGALIEANLLSARVVIVLWSEHSIHSGFVKDEAARARDSSKLHPVRIADVSLPIGFGQLQTFDLLDCGTSDTDVSPLIDQLGRALSKPRAAIAPGRAGASLARVLKRTSTRVAAAGLLAAAVVGFIGRGWWREKQCTQAFVRTDAGVQKLQDGNTEQAVDFFTEAIRMCGGQALPYRYRGEAYARLTDYPPAVADLQVALKLGLEEHAKKRVTELLANIDKAQQNGAMSVSTEPVAPPPPPPPPAPAETTAVRSPSITSGGSFGLPTHARPKPGISVAARPSPVTVEPADAETQQAVKNIFAADKDTRIAATTALVLDPQRVAKAVPLALRTSSEQITNASGVVNTLVLLQSAGPNVLRQHRDEIERLLTRAERNGPETADLVAKVRAAFNPLVYIQIASDAQQALGQRLTRELQANGFEVPAVDNVSTKAAVPAAVPEVRVQGTSSRGVAQIIGAMLHRMAETTPRILSIAKAAPKRDTYEVWLDQRTCVDRQRRPAACNE